LIDNVFEIVMLLCFGVAWPFSIRKAYITKSNGGMSIMFLLVVIFGYIAGIINNVINGINYVIYFYVANMAMIIVNTYLFVQNAKREKNMAKDV
jgi:hypothetical protein